MTTGVETLAAFVAGTRPWDIPDVIAAKARRHILDTFGAALAGSTSIEATRTRLALERTEGTGEAAIWGTDLTLSPRNAALVNGIAAHAFELDDLLAAMASVRFSD